METNLTTYYRLHPKLTNDQRQEVIDWLTMQFGERDGCDPWHVSGNYDFDVESDFDVFLKSKEDVTLFMMAYPNSIRLSLEDGSKIYEDANPQLVLFRY